MRMTKWRTLALATLSFNLSFLVWFSFAPFTGPVGAAFFRTAGLGYAHAGYALVAALVVPIVLLNAYVYRPEIARRANVDGLVAVPEGEVVSADD